MTDKTEEALRREVAREVDAAISVGEAKGAPAIAYALESPRVQRTFDALRDHYQARPTFEGDEAEVREPGWNAVMLWLEERMNFPMQSQPLRRAALRMCGEHYLANKQRDEALARAERAERALADRDAAIVEAIQDAKEACGHDGLRRAFIAARFDRFLPAPEPVDPLVEVLAYVDDHREQDTYESRADCIRTALAARGGKIVFEGEG